MKTIRFLSLLYFGLSLAHSQVITTVVGTDWVFPTYPLPALTAPMGGLTGLVLLPDGSFFVSDADNNQVFKITASGVLTVYAGNGQSAFAGDGGPVTGASIATQQGIAVDGQGNLYVADTNNNRVRKVDTNGVITTVAGNGQQGSAGDGGPASAAQLSAPKSVAVDSSGNLYIADVNNNRIRKVSPNGTISTFAGNGTAKFSGDGPATTVSLNTPGGVYWDGISTLYISDTGNQRVRKIGSDGMLVTVAGNGQPGSAGDGGPALQANLANPAGLTTDTAGNLYIAAIASYRVREVTPDGKIQTIAGNGGIGFSGDGGAAIQAQITPIAVAVNAGGTVFIADQTNGRLRAVVNGTINTIAGTGQYRHRGDGGSATAAVLNNPAGVGLDSQGNLYVTDMQNDAIRMIQPSGTISSFAGTGEPGETGNGGPAKSATLYAPWGLGLDNNGDVYFTEAYTNYVRKVNTSGIITNIAGTGTGGSTGDNGPAAQAQVAGPRSVAADAAGNVYFVEDGSSRLRKISASGVITTVAGTGTPGYNGDEIPAVGAQLNHASGVITDPAGNIYIADFDNLRVRKITTDGKIHTIAGNGNLGDVGDGGPATAAQLNFPLSLAIDTKGDLFIGEHAGRRVREVTTDGIIHTVAGNGNLGFSGDGGNATSASMSQPYGLAVDTSGNLFIADYLNNRVREVLAKSPAFAAAPVTLNFTGTAGATNPVAQTVTMTSLVAGLPYVAITNGSWLSVSPATGTIPSAMAVSVDTTGLAAGNYSGSITIAVPTAVPAAATVNVNLTVVAGAAKPVLATSPGLVSFAAPQGGGTQSASLQISNSGSGSLNYTAAISTSLGGNWLSASVSSGTATPSAPSVITLTAAPGSLAANTYSGSVVISGGGTTMTVPVTLSVSTASPTILLSQTGLAFNAVAQGGQPLPQTFGILNTGTGTMNWSATAASSGNWLQLSSSSGLVQTPYTDVSMVSVTVNPSSLSPGDYYGTIQVTSAAANSPQVMTVILTVMPSGSTPGPDVRPTGLIFTGTVGSTPGSQDVMVGNPKASTDNFISGSIGQGFNYLPTTSIVAPSQPAVVRVLPALASLTSGQIARGTITLQFSDGTPRTISVLTVVAPSGAAAGSSANGLQPQASSCGGSLQVIPRSLRGNFAAIQGQPTTVEVQVIDSCGNLAIPVAPGNPNVSAFFSNGDDKVALVSTGNGIWSGTWRPINLNGGSASVTVNALWVEGATPNAGSVSVAGTVSAAGKTPIISAGGVVQAASFASGAPVTPGSLVTIYGANLADAPSSAPSLPLPQQLSGAQAMLGNTPVPIVFASPGQINVQIPFNAPVNTQYQLTVLHGGAISVPQSLVVAAAQPGVFTTNQSGTGQGVILKADGVTIAQPGTPAAVGEALTIYCTGLGAVNPSVPTGVQAPLSPLSTTTNPVAVTIGGQSASVLFAGLTPGSAGLYQVNAVVPTGVSGDSVPVVLSVAGQVSPPVTISVH